MITFCFCVMGRDARDKEVKGTKDWHDGKRGREKEREREREGGRQVGFVLDGEFTRSVSVLPITLIRHWQKKHRLTLLRSMVQYVWDAKRTVAASRDGDLPRMHAEGSSRDLVIRGLYFTFTNYDYLTSLFWYLSILSSHADKSFATVRREDQRTCSVL